MKDSGAEYYVDVSRLEDYLTHRKDAQDAKKSAPPKRAEDFSPEFTPSGRAYRRPEAWAVPGAGGKRGRQGAAFDPDKFLTDSEKKKAQAIQKKAEAKQARLDAQKSALRQKDKDAVAAQERQREVRERAQSPVKTLIAAVFGVLTLLALCWVGVNIHPDSGTATAAKVQNNLNLTSKLDVYINNAASDALSDLTYIKKIYKIAETDTVAPKPDANAFGTTTDPAVVQAVIADAEELLDGQQTVWQPDLPFYPGTEMYYYRDATILVIVWKEIIEERCATLAEVKIADGSQFRRRLTEDTYGSSVQLYATELAAASNAVVAANADFYAFRQIGLTVYQRQLFRNDAAKLDTCFVTADGDMLFARAGADFVAPYVSRLDNIGADGVDVVEEIMHDFQQYDEIKTGVLAASFRTADQIRRLSKHGITAVTVAPSILEALLWHPMTDNALRRFGEDWNTLTDKNWTELL